MWNLPTTTKSGREQRTSLLPKRQLPSAVPQALFQAVVRTLAKRPSARALAIASRPVLRPSSTIAKHFSCETPKFRPATSGKPRLNDEVTARVDVTLIAGKREINLASREHGEVDVHPIAHVGGQLGGQAEGAEDGRTAAELGRAVVIQRTVAQQLHAIGAMMPLRAEDARQRAGRSDRVSEVVIHSFEHHRRMAHDVAGDDAQVVVRLQVVANHHVANRTAQVEQSADGESDRVRNGTHAAKQRGERVATGDALVEDCENLRRGVAVGVEGGDDAAD